MSQQVEKTTVEIVDEVVEKYFSETCTKTCQDNYYKNKYLEYALQNHNSLQSIVRTYAEALYTGQNITHNTSDLYHANQVLTYVQNYAEQKSKLLYLTTLLNKFLNEQENQQSYLIMHCLGRYKSFRSVEAKTRHKLLMTKTLNNLISNFETIEEFKSLSDSDKEIAKQHLNALLKSISKKNPTSDLFGVRFIVDKIDKGSCSEEELISFCYQLKDDLICFFTSNGIELSEVKDYIQSPKDTGYQSIHLIFSVLGMLIEIQIRTSSMHYVAEYGSASHEIVYKDTIVQNFTRDFMYNLSQKAKLVSNEYNCLLTSSYFIVHHISKTPDGDIPATPLTLQRNDEKFMNFLKEVHK